MMKIIIDYESSWRNSFLDGSNNEKLPKGGRKFIGSMTNLKKPENFLKREITIDTVMGVLNRLIGDQKKLYQAREGSDYFFKDLEPLIRFDDVESKRVVTREMTFIRNITGSTDQNSFTGAIKASDAIFTSDYSKEFWGVLALNFEELLEFILNENFLVQKEITCDPVSIVNIAEELKSLKPLDVSEKLLQAVHVLTSNFPELVTDKTKEPYQEKNGTIRPIRFYAASLYLQQRRLATKFDTSSILSTRRTISGFSKRGYNGKRDFMTAYTTGKPKTIWGNPYIRKERIKGVGEVTSLMTKASGQLEIEIPVDQEQGKEIQSMIENAGVSSFYLGKKGLAYVSKIRV